MVTTNSYAVIKVLLDCFGLRKGVLFERKAFAVQDRETRGWVEIWMADLDVYIYISLVCTMYEERGRTARPVGFNADTR
jgi:hypothetical protein